MIKNVMSTNSTDIHLERKLPSVEEKAITVRGLFSCKKDQSGFIYFNQRQIRPLQQRMSYISTDQNAEDDSKATLKTTKTTYVLKTRTEAYTHTQTYIFLFFINVNQKQAPLRVVGYCVEMNQRKTGQDNKKDTSFWTGRIQDKLSNTISDFRRRQLK